MVIFPKVSILMIFRFGGGLPRLWMERQIQRREPLRVGKRLPVNALNHRCGYFSWNGFHPWRGLPHLLKFFIKNSRI
jgi:hypothetical protein